MNGEAKFWSIFVSGFWIFVTVIAIFMGVNHYHKISEFSENCYVAYEYNEVTDKHWVSEEFCGKD